MADAVLSFALDQLSTLVREVGALLEGLRDEVQLLKDEHDHMTDFLQREEATVENDTSLKKWVCKVRDFAYDAEDILDEFILRFGRKYDDGFLGRVQKVYGSIKNLKARRRLAKETQSLRSRIRNSFDAHQRYQKQPQGSSSAIVQHQNQNQTPGYDIRGDALFVEEADLVGVERPKKELMDMIFTGDSHLCVVSVTGMGGLGKTTLVKKVYDDPNVKNRFKHHAWVAVSQSFKIETLLKDVIRQLYKEHDQSPPDELDRKDANDMRQLVRDCLGQENYILVFDDIWRTTDWDAIRMTFPKKNSGSCIVITSRNIDVGQAARNDIGAGDIYQLKHLTEKKSWTLFCKKAFPDTSCPDHLRKISKDIIKRCDGLPLAIAVIAGVLARRSRRTEEWESFNRSLGAQLEIDDQLDNMTKVISLSYNTLPDILKLCLLYLSIFPEDAYISKGRLIRLWIAEGFVQKREGMTLEEVAEGYLTDLIKRSLVQVHSTTYDGRLRSCRVHDIIHEIILRKAREQGITTIVCEREMEFPAKVRRLSIHHSAANPAVSKELLKCLRSLICLESIDSRRELFQSMLMSNGLRLLKVLDLEGSRLKVIPNEIFKMFLLKYLSLRRTYVGSVPKLIGKLQKLETLDLRWTEVRKLPDEIVKLRQLRHLFVGNKYGDVRVDVPRNIGSLQSLQSLRYINANEMGIVKEIGKLTQLRKLGITELRREDGKELCSSLEKLTNLRSLFVRSINQGQEVIDLQYPLSSTPRFLRNLTLLGRLENAPQWIQSLHGLTKVMLIHSRLRDDPLQLLQDLPNLVELMLIIAYEGEGLCFKAGGFQVLKSLYILHMPELRLVRVEKGAMPLLEYLSIQFCGSMEELPIGIQHLTSLQELNFKFMSDKFVKFVQDIDKESADYKEIAHIPRVEVVWHSEGPWKMYNPLTRETTEMAF